MTLKEQIAGDVQELFFMLEDFGETHKVEGKSIDVVIDNDALTKLKTESGYLADANLLLYARSEDLPKRRAPGNPLNLDGKECIIEDWTENKGVSAVALQQKRSR